MFTEGTSIVVVNYRTPDDLARFLESYHKSVRLPSDPELIIVNVDPEQRDLDIAEHGGFSQHIVAQENVGYARACNQAARQTSREILAFFNADTQLYPGVIEECTAALLAHDGWGILGPRQVNERGQIVHAGILGTGAKPELRGWLQPDRGQFSEINEDAVSVSGSAYFVKRRVWDELTQCELYRDVAPDATGAFLPTRHYYEETACSYHARAHEWKVVYYGPAVLQHSWHKASPVGGYTENVLMPESRELFRNFCDHHQIEHD